MGIVENLNKDLVKITTSCIHKGQLARQGCVFYIATLKWKGMVYTKAIQINRSQVDDKYEEGVKEQFKELFLKQLNDQRGNRQTN